MLRELCDHDNNDARRYQQDDIGGVHEFLFVVCGYFAFVSWMDVRMLSLLFDACSVV